jgi:hypothetical protein
VDYAGPLIMKTRVIGSKTTKKCYNTIFMCMETKGVHLELVAACQLRFSSQHCSVTAQHKKCLQLFSNNGTNFVRSKYELRELDALFSSE